MLFPSIFGTQENEDVFFDMIVLPLVLVGGGVAVVRWISDDGEE